MSSRGTEPKAAYAILAEDEALVANETAQLVADLLGDRDASLVLEEHRAERGTEFEVGPVIDAFLTPPFLIDRRIVLVRGAGNLTAEPAKALAHALAEPPTGAVLILAGGGGTLPAPLKKAVKAAGEIIEIATRTGGQRKSYLDEHLRAGPVRLNAQARVMLTDHLGEDLSRLPGLLETLAAAHGEGVTIDVAMLQPFLGKQGSVPIYELVDAIDAGKTDAALKIVARMMGPGGMSAHVVMASFDNHFSQLAQLDGADVASPADVASLLGIAEYPAKKLWGLRSAIDPDVIRTALGLIADADLDLKGVSGLDERMIVEILVARLCSRMKAAKR